MKNLPRAIVIAAALASCGASYRTESFLVVADSPQVARRVGDAAERYRRELALDWLGDELPEWSQPCPIRVEIDPDRSPAGETSFVFRSGKPQRWRMIVRGSYEAILDSVLPHEITHTILATHFGHPLPRWADEGASASVEHRLQRARLHRMLLKVLASGRRIPLDELLNMRQYPQRLVPLYTQAYSLTSFLVARQSKTTFLEFVAEGMRESDWEAATFNHYGYRSLAQLEQDWLEWVMSSGRRERAETMTASVDRQANGRAP